MSELQEKVETETNRATHIAKVWMESLGLSPHVGFGTLKIGEHTETVDVKKMLSTTPNILFEEVSRIASAFGVQNFEVLDRGDLPQNLTTAEHYESIYLRARTLSRTTNLISEESLARYLPVIRRSVSSAYRRYRATWDPMGIDLDDLHNVSLVYLMIFEHHYAFRSEERNGQILGSFLKQRLGEYAKISGRKMQIPGAALVSAHEDYDPFIYLHADTPETDTDYQDGTYLVEYYDDGVFLRSGVLAVETREMEPLLILDNLVLSDLEVEAFGRMVQGGSIRVFPVDEDPEEKDITYGRRHRARRSLEERLMEMDQDQRAIALTVAVHSRDVDDDVRREARRLCREGVCVSCNWTTTVEATCPKCDGPLESKYGVDPDLYREELERAGDRLVDGFIKTSLYRKKEIQKAAEVAQKPIERWYSREDARELGAMMAEEAMEKLDDFLYCKKCEKTKPKNKFGIRVSYDKYTGSPQKASRQASCKKCR